MTLSRIQKSSIGGLSVATLLLGMATPAAAAGVFPTASPSSLLLGDGRGPLSSDVQGMFGTPSSSLPPTDDRGTPGEPSEGPNDGPQRTPPEPTAGAPYGIHFGPYGLCIDHADWEEVGPTDVVFDHERRLIAIKPSFEFETYVEIYVDDNGTVSAYDDDLVITMDVYADGVDLHLEFVEQYWEPGAEDDPGGGLTTENTPKNLYWKKIEYLGSSTTPSAVLNRHAIPMKARGHFAALAADVARGFNGGDAPDCVRASNLDDIILGGGGADHLEGMAGDDGIAGGDGPDTLEGGSGDDRLYGEGDVDHLIGGGDNDCMDGGEGHRDLLEDNHNTVDANRYIEDPGTVNGVHVDSIDHILEESPTFTDMCFG
ncbi:MAG: hypothetical protein ACRBN8_40415 [Nannocystales bacterium]